MGVDTMKRFPKGGRDDDLLKTLVERLGKTDPAEAGRGFWNGVRDWLTFVVVVIAAAFSYFQWRSMVVQQRAMQGQLDVMIEGDRPWVWLGVSLGEDPIKTTEDGHEITLSVPVTYELVNVGHSPATNVQVWANIVTNQPNLGDTRKKLCQDAVGWSAQLSVGRTLFPGDHGGQMREQVEVSGSIPDIRVPRLYFAEGCVMYRYGNGLVGKTGFAMTLGRIQRGDEFLGPFSIEQDTVSTERTKAYTFRHLDNSLYGLKPENDGGIWSE
jgi:hypothetical protein